MNTTIRPETANDRRSIWNVNRSAFTGDAEADLVDALRDGGFVEASWVADVAGDLVGHVLFSRVTIVTETENIDAVSLAPMAVLPTHQRQGIGSRLVGAGLAACREQGHRIAVVLGHPDFYSRFGFSAKLAQSLESPFGGGDAWMALEFVPGALSGIAGRVVYPTPFDDIA